MDLNLLLSGLRFQFVGIEPSLGRSLTERFALFVVTPGEPAGSKAEVPRSGPDLEIHVRPSDLRQYLPYPSEGGSKIYQLETRERDGRLHVWSYAFAGSFEIDGNQAEVSLCEDGFEPPARSIENFLRVALAWKAVARGGFLLHSAGVVREGRAFLFFGPSGSGKTTAVRMSGGATVLNDDLILIRRIHEAGQPERFVACGLPFKGAEDLGAAVTGSFPIAGIFRLVQSGEDRVERIAIPLAVSELSASVPFVSERPEGLERLFPLLEGVVRSLPVHRLRFRRSPNFWTAVLETVHRGQDS